MQNRTSHFADTNEDLPYCVFVSSKVSKDKKNPLIISLHGLGIGPGYMCQGKAIDEAKAGFMARRSSIRAAEAAKELHAPEASANLSELSEKDAMKVRDTMRKEFNVDDGRTDLMGHSMGDAGELYLGSKYASNWRPLPPWLRPQYRWRRTLKLMVSRDSRGVLSAVVASLEPSVAMSTLTPSGCAFLRPTRAGHRLIALSPRAGREMPAGRPTEILRPRSSTNILGPLQVRPFDGWTLISPAMATLLCPAQSYPESYSSPVADSIYSCYS